MTFKTLIQKMTQAAVRGDGLGVAACFCENVGSQKTSGHKSIAQLVLGLYLPCRNVSK